MERRGSLENYIDDTIMNMIKTVIIIITIKCHLRTTKFSLFLSIHRKMVKIYTYDVLI